MTEKEIKRKLGNAENRARVLREELQKTDTDIQELRDLLKEKLAIKEIPDAPRLSCGETYWYLSSKFVLRSNEVMYDDERDEFNYFHTEKYGKEFAEKCALIAMMLHCKWYLDRDFVPNWNDSDCKYFVYRDASTCSFAVVAHRISEGSIAFSTFDSARKCADWMNEHWTTDTGGIKKGANHE